MKGSRHGRRIVGWRAGLRPTHDEPPRARPRPPQISSGANAEFLRTGRRSSVVPVDFGDAVYKARWYKLVEGIAPEPEKNPRALDDGELRLLQPADLLAEAAARGAGHASPPR